MDKKNFISLIKKMRRTLKKAAILLILLIFSVLFVIGFFIEPNEIIVRRKTLTLSRWDKKHDNLKIAIISDIHAGAPFITLEKIRQLVDLTNREKPDLVLMPGDFVIKKIIGGKFIQPEPIAEILSKLDSKHGSIAVLGNHDWWNDGNRITKALRNKNITVLENSSIELSVNGKELNVAGVLDLTTNFPDIGLALSKIKKDSSILLLSHNPDVFPFVPRHVSLTIAGHTHGGQVKLPVLGRLIVPSIHKEKYAYGYIQENNKNMYVSSGIGSSILPVRFGVKPEIVILTIKSK